MNQSLKDAYPILIDEWDYEKNAPLTPESVGHGSTKTVWWRCPQGHSYRARIDHRTIMHSGCPYCAGKKPIVGVNDLATVFPDIAAEWNSEKNELDPEAFLPKSNKTVWWTCPYCGHEYRKPIIERTVNRVGCTNCSKEKGTSFQEQSILFYLSQSTEAISRYRELGVEVDIYLPELKTAIEYDGRYFHRNRKQIDSAKHAAIRKQGIRLIVVEETDANLVRDDYIGIRSDQYYRVYNADLEWGILQLFAMLELDAPDIDVARDQIQIKEQYIVSRKKDNFAARFPEYATEWNTEKNGSLKPENFTCGSSHKAYFDCPTCGTVYRRKIYDRTIGMGCPVCAGKQIKVGYNDLGTKFPDIAAQWSSRNPIPASAVMPGSDKKAWWHCDTCGSDWQATVGSRTLQGVGCPVCAGKVVVPGFNDLGTLFPEVAQEWDHNKNGELKPSAVRPNSNRRVFWNCTACGHSWAASVTDRTRGRGCPVCARKKATRERINTYIRKRGSLKDNYPELTREWHPDKNGILTPSQITAGSRHKAWWRCTMCGNEWQAVVSSRSKAGNGCPRCAKYITRTTKKDMSG